MPRGLDVRRALGVAILGPSLHCRLAGSHGVGLAVHMMESGLDLWWGWRWWAWALFASVGDSAR